MPSQSHLNESSVRRVIRSLIKTGAALGLSLSVLAGAPFQQGTPLPDLQALGLEGDCPDVRGKVVLLDFFASWCGPCKNSFPVMAELQKQYASKGLVIVAVSVDKKKAGMEQFLKKHPANFSVLWDPAGKLAAQAGISTMPSSFIIDRQGIVRAVHHGFEGEKTRAQYVADIESLLR